MSIVPRLVIDPFLLHLPDKLESKESFESFVMTLTSWAGVMGSDKVAVLVSESCVGCLFQLDAYPMTHAIRAGIEKFELNHISGDFAEKLLQWIFDQHPYFEDAIDTDGVLVEGETIQIEPGSYIGRLNEPLQSCLRDLLLATAYWSQMENRKFDVCFATQCPYQEESDSIRVSALVDGIIPRVNAPIEYKPARAIDQQIECIFDCRDLLSVSNAVDIWAEASSVDSVCKSIEFRVKEHQDSGLSTTVRVLCLHLTKKEVTDAALPDALKSGCSVWKIGSRFLESIHEWNFGNVPRQAELLIDACARILLDCPREPVKAFRESEESKHQIVRDDGALGFRCHLSKSGVAYRLMLWRHPSGVIEFANVANKAECEIY